MRSFFDFSVCSNEESSHRGVMKLMKDIVYQNHLVS